MPINYTKAGMKRPGVVNQWTEEQVKEMIKCGTDITYFAEKYYTIVHPKKGQMLITLHDFQKEMLRNFQGYQNNVVLSARQVGKALSLDTDILTPEGFKKMGELKKGDVIYGADGKKTSIVFITDTMYDRELYEITFDNGEKIKADAEHLWSVKCSDKRGKVEILTTRQMLDVKCRYDKRPTPGALYIDVTSPVEFSETTLPIHPYLLGLWLGDGSTGDGRITCSFDDYQFYKKKINDIGYEISDFRVDRRTKTTGNFNVVGLSHLLTNMSMKKGKYVPEEYINNSLENRVEFLRGLMDSDGYCNKKGTCQFYQSNEFFIKKVSFLLSSMGIKNRVSMKKTSHKDAYRITFTTDLKVFNLPRKLSRQTFMKKHPKNKRIYISSIKNINSEPVRCLQVDNQDHLFLCGKSLIPTHNTTCSGIFILWYAIFNDDKFIAVLANKQLTAKSIIDEIKYAYERLPDWIKPGVTDYNALAIKFDNGTEIMAAPTSPDAIRGQSVSLLFLDEFAFVAANISEDFYRSNYPTVASNGGKIIIVSTPKGSAGKFYEIYSKAEKGENDFKPLKVPWYKVPGRDEAWKEKTIKELGITGFNQEHDCAFTGSTTTLINGDFLGALKYVPPPHLMGDGYMMWKKPESKRIYAAGVDVGSGANSDFSVLNIFDITDYTISGKYEQVAILRRNDLSVFDFGIEILKIAKTWNDALLIIENNGTGLGSVLAKQLYFEDEYENVYYDAEKGEYGINANRKTKSLALVFFKSDIEDKRMKIVSQTMIEELGYYEEQKDGIFGARSGNNFHDDTVSSGYWVSYSLRQPWVHERIEWFLDQIGKGKVLNKNKEEIEDETIADAFTSSLRSTNPEFDFHEELWKEDRD